MQDNKNLIVDIRAFSDIDKIDFNTKYINIDITNYNKEIIEYFKLNGQSYLYSESVNNITGYVYVSYDKFISGESIIDMISKNMPRKLSKLEIARYLYISLGKLGLHSGFHFALHCPWHLQWPGESPPRR